MSAQDAVDLPEIDSCDAFDCNFWRLESLTPEGKRLYVEMVAANKHRWPEAKELWVVHSRYGSERVVQQLRFLYERPNLLDDEQDAGYFYCPYIPLMFHVTVTATGVDIEVQDERSV